MSPLAVHLLKRIALLAVVASLLLASVPRLLVEVGLLGPGVDAAIGSAASALAAARVYGAGEDQPASQRAAQALAQARTLQAQGRDREARLRASQALAAAIEAQRDALLQRAQQRQRARAIYDDFDQQVIDLEKLYDQVAPGLDQARTSRMLSRMKATRQRAGLLFLAFEQEDYAGVVASEAAVREAITGTAQALREAGRR